MRRPTPWILLLLLGLMASPMWAAQGSEAEHVLGNDGTLYRLLNGTYGELFGDPESAEAAFPVLALEINSPGGESERHLVPETGTRDREASPLLVLEESSQVLYLLWEELFNGIHPSLQLTRFDGETWSPVVEIASGPFSRKGSPQLEVTRELSVSGVDRSIAHLTWWQGGTASASRKYYAPIVLAGGVEQGNTPIFDLGEFFASDEARDGVVPEALGDLLVVQPGGSARSVVAGFLDPRSQRIRTLRSEMVPGVLTNFSDKARLEIVITGQRLNTKQALAEEMRHRLSVIGAGDFHPASLVYMVDGVADYITQWSGDLKAPGELESLAEKARLEIVITGTTIDANGLPAEADAYLLDVGALTGVPGDGSVIKISRGGSWALPEFDDTLTEARLFVSASGRQALLAWQGEKYANRVTYRTTQDDGWSDSSYVEVRPDLDLETIYRLLAQQMASQ